MVREFTINERLDMITGSIYRTKPDIIAFSAYIWNKNEVFEIADRLKQIKPDLIIIMGGPEVSFESLKIMKNNNFIDFIIKGEGEKTLKELLHSFYLSETLNDKEFYNKLAKIKGIVYRAEEKKICENKERPLISNLDKLPFPYTDENIKKLKNKIIYYETSRGCPFNCSYCLSSINRGVRYFSMERVKKDLLFFIRNDIKLIKFVDRTFNSNRKRTMEIFKFLVENRKETRFHFEITANLLDDEMIKYLMTVPEGLFQFEIGIQSSNLETLRLVNRRMDFKKVSKYIKSLREANNIHLHLDLIAGLPGEDYNSFEKSFNDVFELTPHDLQLGFLKLLKGTAIRSDGPLHEYKYSKTTPYEVLQNKYMSYKEILELKGIEDILKKYFNSNRFEKSLEYTIKNHYPESAFAFFQELSHHFINNGLDRRAQSQSTLYNILYDFYSKKIGEKEKIFAEYLKFDLFLNNRGVRLPDWFNMIKIPHLKEMRYNFLSNEENIKKLLPGYINMSVKEILKRVSFEVFSINVLMAEKDSKNGDSKRPFIYLLDHTQKKAFDITDYFN